MAKLGVGRGKIEKWIQRGVHPLPIPNVEVAPQVTVDALWPEHRLVVECDGKQNHGSDAQPLRDADQINPWDVPSKRSEG